MITHFLSVKGIHKKALLAKGPNNFILLIYHMMVTTTINMLFIHQDQAARDPRSEGESQKIRRHDFFNRISLSCARSNKQGNLTARGESPSQVFFQKLTYLSLPTVILQCL
jgi:hypothetical protein